MLGAQAASRVQELVPIRHGRMLVSPFTFYRGAAAVMAADLAATPDSGIVVQACGEEFTVGFDRIRPWLTQEAAANVDALRAERPAS